MKTKRMIAVLLTLMLTPGIPVFSVRAESGSPAIPSFLSASGEGLYAHAAAGSSDTEAWSIWQSSEDKKGFSEDLFMKYFFLPSSADKTKAEIFNGYSDNAVEICGTTIQPNETALVNYTAGTLYNVTVGGEIYRLIFKNSTAEAAIYANNTNADNNGTPLYEYIKTSKSVSASAKGAIADKSGAIDNTSIKKIKGRGNTTWEKAKKPFNITYSSNVSIAGMEKGKKFSLLANYQDASLARNRILYDLSDAVGMPYASDSRFVDFYMNGVYYGSYQCAQKIEAGKNELLNDISDTDYISENGSLADNFSFCIEIDPSYSDDDYHFSTNSNQITIKSPELASDEQYYSEVKNKIKSKFNALFTQLSSSGATYESLSETIDIDSFAKLYLINELGKNWDSGVSSLYMVYKQSPDGKWRFYASPVWDYDNSLGNCVGIEQDLNNMGVYDYSRYTGWWCKFKGKSAGQTSSSNIMNKCANNPVIIECAAKNWIERFVPRINSFAKTDSTSGEMYSASGYYRLLEGTADMNYTRGWLLNTGSWISDHSSLKKAEYKNGRYNVASSATVYTADFEGEYNYMVDWLTSRAAWLTNEFSKKYRWLTGDVNIDGRIGINDVTLIQYAIAKMISSEYNEAYADFDGDGLVTINDATKIQLYIAGRND